MSWFASQSPLISRPSHFLDSISMRQYRWLIGFLLILLMLLSFGLYNLFIVPYIVLVTATTNTDLLSKEINISKDRVKTIQELLQLTGKNDDEVKVILKDVTPKIDELHNLSDTISQEASHLATSPIEPNTRLHDTISLTLTQQSVVLREAYQLFTFQVCLLQHAFGQKANTLAIIQKSSQLQNNSSKVHIISSYQDILQKSQANETLTSSASQCYADESELVDNDTRDAINRDNDLFKSYSITAQKVLDAAKSDDNSNLPTTLNQFNIVLQKPKIWWTTANISNQINRLNPHMNSQLKRLNDLQGQVHDVTDDLQRKYHII